MRVWLGFVLTLVGCGGGGGNGAVDATPGDPTDANAVRFVDAMPGEPRPALANEPFPTPVPNTVYSGGFAGCEVFGRTMAQGQADIYGDCTICQCTTYGGRCARRAACARDVCVFADGSEVARGETVRVRGCFECTCDEAGGTCRADPNPECPQDGCVLPRGAGEVAPGEHFVSECHQCICDLETGLLCRDLCHPACTLRDADGEILGSLPDQARMPADNGCGSCVCDYYDLVCDNRAC